MPDYLTAKRNECVTFEKGSRFIGILVPVSDDDDAVSELEKIRRKYFDATHVCYAYIADENGSRMRFSDDGEPSGTAGLPILGLLKARGLKKVLLAVVRYFGGTKLGVGGLKRAYTECASLAEQSAEKTLMREADLYRVALDYSVYNAVFSKLTNIFMSVISVEYSSLVTVTAAAEKGSDAIKAVTALTEGAAITEYLGTRYTKIE